MGDSSAENVGQAGIGASDGVVTGLDDASKGMVHASGTAAVTFQTNFGQSIDSLVGSNAQAEGIYARDSYTTSNARLLNLSGSGGPGSWPISIHSTHRSRQVGWPES